MYHATMQIFGDENFCTNASKTAARRDGVLSPINCNGIQWTAGRVLACTQSDTDRRTCRRTGRGGQMAVRRLMSVLSSAAHLLACTTRRILERTCISCPARTSHANERVPSTICRYITRRMNLLSSSAMKFAAFLGDFLHRHRLVS